MARWGVVTSFVYAVAVLFLLIAHRAGGDRVMIIPSREVTLAC